MAPYDPTRIETAKAARWPPKASSGMVYIFTLNADTAKTLREITAEAHAAVGVSGTRVVANENTEASRHTRKRAPSGATPRPTKRKESQPPARPPVAAKTGGIHAYHAAWTSV